MAENSRMGRVAAALLASGLLVALCVSTGRDRLSVGIEALQRPGQPSVVQQSLSSILGVDSQGRRAIASLIRKTEQSWQKSSEQMSAEWKRLEEERAARNRHRALEDKQIKKAEERLFKKHEDHLLARAEKVTLAKIRAHRQPRIHLNQLDRQVLRLSNQAGPAWLPSAKGPPSRPDAENMSPAARQAQVRAASKVQARGKVSSDDLDAELDSFFQKEKQKAKEKAAMEAAARKAAAKRKAAEEWADAKMKEAIQKEKEEKKQEKKKMDHKFEEYRSREVRKIHEEEEKKEHDEKVDALIQDTIQQVVAGKSPNIVIKAVAESPRSPKPAAVHEQVAESSSSVVVAKALPAARKQIGEASKQESSAKLTEPSVKVVTAASMARTGEARKEGTVVHKAEHASAGAGTASAVAPTVADTVLHKEVEAVAGGKVLAAGDLLGDLAAIMSNSTSRPAKKAASTSHDARTARSRSGLHLNPVSKTASIVAIKVHQGQEERAGAATPARGLAPSASGHSDGEKVRKDRKASAREEAGLDAARAHVDTEKAAALEKKMQAILARAVSVAKSAAAAGVPVKRAAAAPVEHKARLSPPARSVKSKAGARASRASSSSSGAAGSAAARTGSKHPEVPSVASLQDDFAKIQAAEMAAQAKIARVSFRQEQRGQHTQLLQVLAEGEGGGTGEELGVGAGVAKVSTAPSSSSGASSLAPDASGFWYAPPSPKLQWNTVQERGPGGWVFEGRANTPSTAGQTPPAQPVWAAAQPAQADPVVQWQVGEGYLPQMAPAQPTQNIFKTLPSVTTSGCDETWCREGWGKDYDAAHNISQDPFGDNDAFRAYTAMPAAGPISTVKPVEQMIQARVSPLEAHAQQYVMVPLSPLTPEGGGVPQGAWAKVEQGFNVSSILNDTATLSAQVYNDTLSLYNDTESALTWPDWQEQWAAMEEEEEEDYEDA